MNAGFTPATEEVRGVRRYLLLELLLILFVAAFAATMARYTSF